MKKIMNTNINFKKYFNIKETQLKLRIKKEKKKFKNIEINLLVNNKKNNFFKLNKKDLRNKNIKIKNSKKIKKIKDIKLQKIKKKKLKNKLRKSLGDNKKPNM
jgi:hypothetical protein